MSEWGLWTDELDDITLSLLTRSYVRRKRWEANVFWNAGIGESSASSHTQYKRVNANELMSAMGAKWR